MLVCSKITNQRKGGSNVYDAQVTLKLALIKLVHTKWLLSLYDHLRNSLDTITKGFAMAGIKDAFVMELPLEDPFADLDA